MDSIEMPENLDDIAGELKKRLAEDKLLFRSFFVVIVSTLLFGVAGCLLGLSMGLFAPAYFTQFYEASSEDVMQISLGIGLKNGLICGVIAGSAVVLSTAWYRSRMIHAVSRRMTSPD